MRLYAECYLLFDSDRTSRCSYYFGPFDSEVAAQDARSDDAEDRYKKGARDMVALSEAVPAQHPDDRLKLLCYQRYKSELKQYLNLIT
jgi:hypothetical protein